MDRCTHVRVGDKKVPMTESIKSKILETTRQYSTGRDTLRCLALAVIENPMSKSEMDIADSTKFANYEINATFVGVCGYVLFNQIEYKKSSNIHNMYYILLFLCSITHLFIMVYNYD